MILDRSAFISVDDTDFQYVDVPEAAKDGGEVPQVRVRSLTGDQRIRLYARAKLDDAATTQAGNWRALACAMGMVDDKGAYLFPNEVEGASILGKKHPELIERISDRIIEISSMTKASREAAEKKLRETTTSSGGTSLPAESTQATDSASIC